MRLKGYIFSRPFLGERVPQHIQNIVIRDYCVKNNFTFLMSATEYAVKDSLYILSELIDNLKNYDGIVFYSLFRLANIFHNYKLPQQISLRVSKSILG
jgi:sporadic carbohydrate cluster protein (TIGR04323 family)